MNTNKIKLNKNNELSPLIKYMVVKKNTMLSHVCFRIALTFYQWLYKFRIEKLAFRPV